MRNFLFIICSLLFACNGNVEQNKMLVIKYAYNDGSDNELNDFDKYTATVLTFLAPECPLSENYTKTLNDLEQLNSDNNIRFINVFAGRYHSRESIDSFKIAYALTQNVIYDETFLLAQTLNATVTPEVFVINSKGKLVYSGAIDNWAVDLGQKRQVITEFYLRDVLTAMINQASIPYAKTTPVGCFIETKKSK